MEQAIPLWGLSEFLTHRIHEHDDDDETIVSSF